ncbi:UbiA prenyltransferase [Helicosporidium sp. ATCC 50920]|nr:UbiA prenyltransferase [Helicosporidium sp. ATCC 50920]|eukprot:KDD75870.1 UbiA prenyltransferase [Helicosporidium sp. ATCC 50920]
MRLDKPIGTWLLAWPSFWALAMAPPAGALPDATLVALFGLGAVLLRGSGCTLNDMLDRDVDRQVERTKGRPLARGALRRRQALALLAAQLGLGFGIWLQLPFEAQALGICSLGLVGVYPLMKRFMNAPQLVLGLAMNWGVLMGWAASTSAWPVWPAALPLFGAGVAWTLVYDTIYAFQDIRDDERVGVRSTARSWEAVARPAMGLCAAAAGAALAAAGGAVDAGPLYYAGAAAFVGHLAWQVAATDLKSRAVCNRAFESNKWAGGILAAGIFLDHALHGML